MSARVTRWYLLPLPLAILAAMAMPWIAVRDVRQSRKAFGQLCDIMLIAYRRDQAETARPRHLRLVK